MVGNKSIYRAFTFKNTKYGNEVTVIVQADKSLRICDIIFPFLPSEPQRPTDKEGIPAYKEAKEEYDRGIASLKRVRQNALNNFRGRQFNSPEVIEVLRKILLISINA